MAQPAGVEKMNGVHVLALCGESLLIEGLKASLQGHGGVEIVPLDASLPGAVQDLQKLSPDIIIFELTPSQWNYIFTFLRKGTDAILIGLDITCDNALFLPGEWRVLPSVEDLMQGIEERIQAKNGRRL